MSSYEYDEGKSRRNDEERGLPFDDVYQVFNDPHRVMEPDTRFDYGEPRFRIIGKHQGTLRVMLVVFTPRNATFRIISYRKANPREVERYEANRNQKQ
jgi:uncharacterized protein